jgi:hypothetical protein
LGAASNPAEYFVQRSSRVGAQMSASKREVKAKDDEAALKAALDRPECQGCEGRILNITVGDLTLVAAIAPVT